MILGILSDTHGQTQRTAHALRILRQAGAEAFVHCGDIGGVAVLDELAGLRAWLVAGNTDFPDSSLLGYAKLLGLTCQPAGPLRLELHGRSLAVFHGHEPQFAQLFEPTPVGSSLRAALASCDYILHGHTHMACDLREGPWRVINPGALHQAGLYTVATLDLASDTLQFWQVLDDAPDAPPTRFFL